MLSEIWQNEKQRLANSLYQRLLQGRDAVSCLELLGNGLPEVLEILVSRRVQRHVEEAFHLLNPASFNLEKEVLQQRLDDLKAGLIFETKLTASELEQACHSAVALQWNVLVRPRTTLCVLLFESANERAKDDVIVVAEGFGEERLFIRKLVATLQELDSPHIVRDLFETISRTAEQSVLGETPISALLTEFKLVMDFESQVTAAACTTIGSPTLLGMLVERELDALADDLQEESGKESWTLGEIESVLERYWLVGRPGVVESGKNSDAVSEKEVDGRVRFAFVEE
ncbi:MAG TPA: hypothetical protein VGA99_00070 [bacterium]